jgi:hypothetical protein
MDPPPARGMTVKEIGQEKTLRSLRFLAFLALKKIVPIEHGDHGGRGVKLRVLRVLRVKKILRLQFLSPDVAFVAVKKSNHQDIKKKDYFTRRTGVSENKKLRSSETPC